MKALVTGGAGFIGLHLARYLSRKGWDITLCDNLFRGESDDELKQLTGLKGVRFVEVDLTSRKDLDKLEKHYDIVYHLAAINGTKYFYEIPYQVLRINILSLINILDWIKDSNCNRLIWTSSSEVYSSTARILDIPVPTPETVPLAIDDEFNPRLSYAGSKMTGELLCLNYAREQNLNLTIVRPHNVYGERMGYEHVIPEFIMRILNRENPFKIYGHIQTRAFCYVEDFVKGLELIAESSMLNSAIINLGNDKEETSIENLARKMFSLFQFDARLELLPAPAGSADRRCPDISKARRVLGYEPEINLEEGLDRTYKWYSKRLLK